VNKAMRVGIDVSEIKRLETSLEFSVKCPCCGCEADYDNNQYFSHVVDSCKEALSVWCEHCNEAIVMDAIFSGASIMIEIDLDSVRMDG